VNTVVNKVPAARSKTIRTAAAELPALKARVAPSPLQRPAAAVTISSPALAASSPTRLHWPLIWTFLIAGLIVWGSHAHLERYITPQRGVGYALGIIGGSLMLVLLIYSARKRIAWLRWMGSIPAWFEIHMVLGVVGPILVLFHSNFSLGATNSNVALFSMLLVAGSGVIGRYIYTRLHARLEGHEDTLEHLKSVGERLRLQKYSGDFLPGLLDAIERVERRLIEPPKGSIARVLHLSTGAVRITLARWLMRRAIKDAVQTACRRESRIVARHAQRLGLVARHYANRRLDAGRRMTEFKAYSRLFSFWHVLHIPLFFMLLIAGTAHVIAINVY
jgi:hypothetical protein